MTNTADSALALLGVDLDGQKVVVVGAGGIGYEIGRVCAALGARLTLFDVAEPDRTVFESFTNRDRHQWVVADITAPAEQQHIVDQCADADALVITSAVCPDETLIDPKDDDAWTESFQQVFTINTAAPMRICQRVLPTMAERGRGRIVLLSSLGSRNGGLLSGAQYAASKGALNSLVRWLAMRAAPAGVSVNAVVPGATETPILGGRPIDASRIPAGRMAQPIEVARAVAFLASPAASYIHGVSLDVNGGAWMG